MLMDKQTKFKPSMLSMMYIAVCRPQGVVDGVLAWRNSRRTRWGGTQGRGKWSMVTRADALLVGSEGMFVYRAEVTWVQRQLSHTPYIQVTDDAKKKKMQGFEWKSWTEWFGHTPCCSHGWTLLQSDILAACWWEDHWMSFKRAAGSTGAVCRRGRDENKSWNKPGNGRTTTWVPCRRLSPDITDWTALLSWDKIGLVRSSSLDVWCRND